MLTGLKSVYSHLTPGHTSVTSSKYTNMTIFRVAFIRVHKRILRKDLIWVLEVRELKKTNKTKPNLTLNAVFLDPFKTLL